MEKIVFVDTETTGVEPHKGHRVIEIACIEYQNGKKTGRQFNTRLYPDGKSSDKGAFKTHGISDSELVNEPLFKDVLPDFIEIVKDAHIVAYNASFDMSFINLELLRAEYPSTIYDICSRVSCAMEMATRKFNLKRRVKLDAACKRYKIDISNRQIHNALLDAQLCAEVYFKLIDESQVPLKRTPQSNKHKETKPISLPKAYKSKQTGEVVQVNFCKNSECKNFGVPAKNPTYKNYKTKELKRGLGNDYNLTKAKDGTYQLTCLLCGESTTLIHNRCFTLESERVKAIGKQIEPSCPKSHCNNHGVGIFSSPEQYSLEGKTRSDRTWAHVTPSKARDKHGKPLKDVTFIKMNGSKRILCKVRNNMKPIGQ